MRLTFIHVSDIHFGQESGGQLVTHTDIRDRLIDDVEKFVRGRGNQPAHGAIVTGDIAYAGKKHEYDAAGLWLDKLAVAGRFDRTDVMLTPGNHDADRDEISLSGAHLQALIKQNGDKSLDAILESEKDREILYAKLRGYRLFAAAYGCELSDSGGHAGQRTRPFDAGSTRALRFISLNSAIACGKENDKKGELLLGARQRIIAPAKEGEETIVFLHHPPPDWFSDGADAMLYFMNRSRVVMCGHEHVPNWKVDPVLDRGDFLTIRAGAATPPYSSSTSPYTYNIIDFEVDENRHRMTLVIHPRDWDNDLKAFAVSKRGLSGGQTSFRIELACAPRPAEDAAAAPSPSPAENPTMSKPEFTTESVLAGVEQPHKISTPEELTRFAHVRLQFFRDLKLVQRLKILIDLGALPADLREERLTITMEQRVMERLFQKGKLEELEKSVCAAMASTKPGAK